MTAITEIAPAKLNLGLKVLGRRPDGYHDLLSIVQTIDLCDRLVLEPGRGGSGEVLLSCSEPGIPAGPDNLVIRSGMALKEHLRSQEGARIHLQKGIPAGGGLGGGSSDAAAALRGLCRLWRRSVAADDLLDLAASIGSDVPFLLKPGTARMEGRGERLHYFSATGQPTYVLVFPEVRIATSWAFANVRIGLTEASAYVNFLNSRHLSESVPMDRLFECIENDFLPLLVERFPEIRTILDAIRKTSPIAASLSGSGSTLYGIYPDDLAARKAAAELADGGFRTVVARPTGPEASG